MTCDLGGSLGCFRGRGLGLLNWVELIDLGAQDGNLGRQVVDQVLPFAKPGAQRGVGRRCRRDLWGRSFNVFHTPSLRSVGAVLHPELPAINYRSIGLPLWVNYRKLDEMDMKRYRISNSEKVTVPLALTVSPSMKQAIEQVKRSEKFDFNAWVRDQIRAGLPKILAECGLKADSAA